MAFVLLATLFGSVLAAPLLSRQQADAPYSVDEATLAAAVTCPNGTPGGAAGGAVLLVHGTGLNGSLTWTEGPYLQFLPSEGPTYDVCYVDLPQMALGDAQISAEYVAYNIEALAKQSATGKVSIIGHSQGAGLNPQWALEFWPSKRQYVHAYIALAGDFHGTVEGILVCTPQKLAQGGCEPAIWQQKSTSNYIAAQNTLGGQALVPTTSIYTVFDEVVVPENPPELATSNLPGAAVFALQDVDVCGPLHLAEHVSMVVDGGAYALAKDALLNGVADPARIENLTLGACNDFRELQGLPGVLNAALVAAVAIAANNPRVPEEPPLMPYVCAAGAATVCG